MIASERFSRIVESVNKRGFISTKELSECMGVTETTIRRDCEELEKQGLLIRVHGGAKSIKQKMILSDRDEKSMSERIEYSKEKDIISKRASEFVKDGDCIFLDGGTSIVPILKYIKGKKVKIVTHSQLIVNMFDDSEAELFVIGGKYIPEYNMSVGPITLSDIEKFNFDHAFISCAGVDIERKLVYTAEMDTMAVKQKAMNLSVRKYLLADSSKLSVKGFCSFISSDDFDAVICNVDENISEEELPDNYILV
ncbi:DeoR/GlpR transcriptional regulator [Peptacetobacter hominis]|uniref:Lactose phosphotransferase system repressor n=1 Tax=Peptacetobacter hominis TaxID=2743610 RepID=A0A544QW44_9FIRM|nr:DeoR/GlpR family DNA-binding transcription regulator [Peptacetobacter hominis]TQQ84902.1 DeoR/GlpR transcriptional regulator [Peptacetobacter hominis]